MTASPIRISMDGATLSSGLEEELALSGVAAAIRLAEVETAFAEADFNIFGGATFTGNDVVIAGGPTNGIGLHNPVDANTYKKISFDWVITTQIADYHEGVFWDDTEMLARAGWDLMNGYFFYNGSFYQWFKSAHTHNSHQLTYVSGTTYHVCMEHIGNDIWQWLISGGIYDNTPFMAERFSGTDFYFGIISCYYGGVTTTINNMVKINYSSSAETAELVALSGAYTWDCSTLTIPAAIAGVRLATSSTKLLLDYCVDSGIWQTNGGAHYTVAEFQAVTDFDSTATLEIKLYVTGDGTEQIEVFQGSIDGTAAAGTVPGAPAFSVSYGGAGKIDWTLTHGSNAASSKLLYRKVTSTTWTQVAVPLVTTSGTISSLDRTLYVFEAVSISSAGNSLPAGCQTVFCGVAAGADMLPALRDKLRTVGISGVDDASILCTMDDLQLARTYPSIIIWEGDSTYEARADGNVYAETPINVTVFMESHEGDFGEEIFITAGLAAIVREVILALQPHWSPDYDQIMIVNPKSSATAAPTAEGDKTIYSKNIVFTAQYYLTA